jgi:hypothetical protein
MSNSTTDYDLKALVLDLEGEDFFLPPVTYQFSMGKVFQEQPNSGIYEVPPTP